MAPRTHSADPRAERVRTLLRDAAFALAHDRPVDRITVADVVATAGVSRQVFYQHFADRDDAVASAFDVAFAASTASIDGDPRERILRVFDLAAEHREMYHHVVPSAVAARVVSAFRAALLPACEEMVRQAMPVLDSVSGLHPDAVSRFLVGGLQEVLRSWMDPTAEGTPATDLRTRVTAALDTVDALLRLPRPVN